MDKDGKCTKDPNKGCECRIIGEEFDEDAGDPVDFGWLTAQQAALGLLEGSTPDTTNDDPSDRKHPSANPTCSANSASSVPQKIKATDKDISPNELMYRLRQAMCTNGCDLPEGIPSNVFGKFQDDAKNECELAVALPNDVEAWAYRGTPSTGLQWQDCWDSTANITETCIKNGPNTGWVNGPDDFQVSARSP